MILPEHLRELHTRSMEEAYKVYRDELGMHVYPCVLVPRPTCPIPANSRRSRHGGRIIRIPVIWSTFSERMDRAGSALTSAPAPAVSVNTLTSTQNTTRARASEFLSQSIRCFRGSHSTPLGAGCISCSGVQTCPNGPRTMESRCWTGSPRSSQIK
jgi:hypothetical protein